ncbi:hypothetical protein [Colwellia sp. Bg11-28]|uniref:hypothetical protein n=1 Tax=Colwellia sp. Bg11-28 TaxID=2058305 RepID=UPI000C327634|nr:hypothetical protein [Colwellia sp. Bg11-28]PKH88913.1 hypothetical protein CXF79_03240 [Colwellia sp. Bg11-28]
MKLINEVLNKIEELGQSKSADLLANGLASACNSNYKISLLDIAVSLDTSNKKLVKRLSEITQEEDYSNASQDHALTWLRQRKYII